jgi:GT2 family glycosyltransferase
MRVHETDAVAAVIVTYNPDDRLTELIRSLQPQVGAIWIIDNNSSADARVTLQGLESQSGGMIRLIVNPENRGLAVAQNQGISAALGLDYDWVLLMDHDSVPDVNMVSEMLLAARAYQAPEKIGFMVPCHDDDRGLPASSVFRRGRFGILRWGPVRTGKVEDRTAFAMASGCLIPAERIREIGPMAEDFFIDYIDHDFSLRVRRAGYRIVVVGAARLKHRLGELREGRFLWLSKAYREHSARRRYTIYRNRIRVMIGHGFRFPEFIQFEIMSIAKDFLGLVCWEDEKIPKIRSIFSGISDGLKRRDEVRRN